MSTKTDQEQVQEFLIDTCLLDAIEEGLDDGQTWHETTGSLWEAPCVAEHAVYVVLTCDETASVARVHASVETTGQPGWQAFLLGQARAGSERRQDGITYYCRTADRWAELAEQQWTGQDHRLIARWDAGGVRIEPNAREEWFT